LNAESACHSSHEANPDPVRDLNNYLQGHPSGNLAPFLSWALAENGPDHQKTHYATAKCESVFQPDLEPCAESRVTQSRARKLAPGRVVPEASPRRRLPSEL